VAVPSTPGPPPSNNRGLLIAVIAVGAAFLLALGLLIGLLVSRSSSNVETTTPTTVKAVGTASSTSSSSSTSTSTTSTSTSSSTTSSTTSTTAAPTTTTSAASGLTQVCTSDPVGVRVRYPTAWHTSSGSGTDCLLFDPEPIVVIPQTESPLTAVYLSMRDLDRAAALAEETNPDFATVESQVPMTFGSREGVCVTMTSTGAALLEAGTRLYECLVDFDGRTLIVGSHRPPGAPAIDYDPTVRAMAAAVTPL